MLREVLDWSRSDPEGLLAAARTSQPGGRSKTDPHAQRLLRLMTNEADPDGLRHLLREELLHARPEALVEAIQILNAHRDEVERVLLRYGYTDPRPRSAAISIATSPIQSLTDRITRSLRSRLEPQPAMASGERSIPNDPQ